ncbi:hypothetical protein [Candidimonas nitroreducens]|uniref:Uncharacterized protein n=1 Tax=Candidimonas nitroreducens TaxID=683354 RepID=A0A225MLG2_9BURK|nr:hypothetical protein [Candidimonas nitroreducens]OWT62015.1 hypothetical protein CEY11_09420 [Candidimonas nitroreducens]
MSDIPDIDETLAETYRELRAKGAFGGDFGEEPPTPAEPPAAAAAETPAQTDDASEADTNAENTVAEPPDEGAEASAENGEEDAAPPESAFRPPWKKAALAEFEKLSPGVRAEIERRENDFHKGIEQYKAGAESSKEWDRTVQPYLATIQGFGVTPQRAAQELFKADHLLRYSPMPQKVGMLLKIAGDYGIDLPTLAQGLQNMAGQQAWQQQNPPDPRVQQLQTQIQQMQQQQFQAQQQASQAENSAIDDEIAAFAADPDHEHFSVLQPDMALLLQGGRAKDLESAYEMAMRANPQTYPIWLAQQQQKADEERRKKVQSAKKAAANNVRPNGRASIPAAPAHRTMEEDIEATARELGLIN